MRRLILDKKEMDTVFVTELWGDEGFKINDYLWILPADDDKLYELTINKNAVENIQNNRYTFNRCNNSWKSTLLPSNIININGFEYEVEVI